MPRGNFVCAQCFGIVEKGTELDFFVAENIGVGGAPRTILFKEMLKDVVPIFCREVGSMQLYTQRVSDPLSVG